MALAFDLSDATEIRITYAQPVSDEMFLAVAAEYEAWRAELDGAFTIVLMPPHGNDTSALCLKLGALVYNWNQTLAEPGVVFDSDTRFRYADRSLHGPDCAWISAQLERERQAAGLTFGETIPEIVIELRSQTDSWPSQLRAIERWRDNGALYAIAIDPQQHRVEHRSTGTLSCREQFEAVLAIAHIIAGP